MSSLYDPPPADHATQPTKYVSSGQAFDVSETESHCADATIAKALQGLSLEEREQIYMDQHGVTDIAELDSDPEVVARKLLELEQNLETMSCSHDVPSEAYELAKKQNPEYFRKAQMHLRFLYAELFDTRKAASRMIRYFNYKRKLFGDDKLTKHVGLEDLTNVEMALLKGGFTQKLPARDTAGRPVWVCFPLQAGASSAESLGRIFMVMATEGDEFIEKKGVVIVPYHIGLCQPIDVKCTQEAYIASRAISDLEMRVAAVHQCSNDQRFHLLVDVFMKLSTNETRAKHKIHCGTHSECMNALMAYGIPHHLFPMSGDGKIKRKHHLEWLRTRKTIEQYRASSVPVAYVELPSNIDILFGKGNPIQEHWGNKNLQHLLDESLPQYDALKGNKAKKQMCLKVVRHVIAQNGKFLTQESGVWTEVSEDFAREKVSRMFRNRRTARSLQSNNQGNGQKQGLALNVVEDDRQNVTINSKDVGSDFKRVRLG